MKMRVMALTMLVVGGLGSTSAQTKGDSFGKPGGIYLTSPVRHNYRVYLAKAFADGAEEAGFSRQETRAISQVFLDEAARLPGVPGGSYSNLDSGHSSSETHESNLGDVYADVYGKGYPQCCSEGQSLGEAHSVEKGSFLLRTFHAASDFLEQFSTIKLVVQPAPPRDYKVIINGEECPATEAGIYKVLPGDSVIDATRPSKQKCEWHGSIAAGATQEVDCPL
jgi:hypothetical protein